jgi:uncharacterized repeat protein (TIGR01451 family)/fimbrial isopeptide formation D2 family protein
MGTPNVGVPTSRRAQQCASPFGTSLGGHTGCPTRWRSLAARSIALLFSAILAFAATPAAAATITYVSVTGIWHDPTDNVPGVQPGDPVITNGAPTSIIRWGTTSGTPQSGYDYTTTVPPPITLPGTGPLFTLGTFTHRNFEVGDPSLTSVLLDVVLVLDVDGVPTGPLTFTFKFNHEETPNNLNPCPYPTPPGEGCTDRVTIISSAAPTTFKVDGVDYTLSMGFTDSNGNPVSEFITREGGVLNTSGLTGQFTLAPIPPNQQPLLAKATTQPTATIGEPFRYRITVPATPHTAPLYDVRILDDLDASAADMEFVSVTKVSGPGAWTPVNTGTSTNLVIEGNGGGIDIPIGEQAVIDVTVRLRDTPTNVAGLTFANTSSFTYDQLDNDGATQQTGRPGTSGQMTIVEPDLTLLKSGPPAMALTVPGAFRLDVHNAGGARAFGSIVTDRLPNTANGGMCNAAPTQVTAQVFQADGVTPVAAALAAGTDYTVAFAGAPTCTVTLTMLTPTASIGPNEHLMVGYNALLDATTQPGASLTNVAGSTDWYSVDPSTLAAYARHYARVVTDGTPGVLDFQDAHTTLVGTALPLTITKQVSVVGNGPAIAGATLDYVVTVRNPGSVTQPGVYITDNLDENAPAYLLYVDQSALLNGSTTGISIAGPVITANYGALAPGQTIELRFQAKINPNLAIGTHVTNTGHVTWNSDQTAAASVSIDVGGMVGSGILSGAVWHDANFNDVLDTNERVLQGWTVDLQRNGTSVATTTTDAAGTYHFTGVVPNYQTPDKYELIFRAPGAGPRTALLGLANSQFSNALQRIYDIIVQSGSNLQNLNLPIDPDGVVYNSMARIPLAGTTLTLVDLNTDRALAAACFDDPNQQGQVTRTDGYYKFDINFSDPTCPNGGSYRIDVVPPSTGYETGYSRVIPPTNDATKPPFDVPMCAGGADDAIPTTIDHCEMTTSEFAPPTSVAAASRGTAYQVRLVLDGTRPPGSSQLFNNHIPVDPTLTGVVAITKTTPMTNVTKGQMVPYTITVKNAWPFALTGVDVLDRYPVGFRYVDGSARFDDQPLEPKVANGMLLWQNLTLAPNGQHTIKLLLAAGAGITEGKFTNYAFARQTGSGLSLSGEASATVQVVPDPTFDCTDVTGKVFDDKNRNGIQDPGEAGIPGARLITPTGLAALTDGYGRFHITCAITPREGRGSNFMLKLDDRSLPSGYRSSTDQFQIQRATRGKALHFAFGASIHRVVGLDIADAVFAPDSTDMRAQWRPRVNLLVEELQKGPAILRLSYLADVEDPKLVESRISAMTKLVTDSWSEAHGGYPLVIEHEVFWRTGKPPSEDPRLKGLQQASSGKPNAGAANTAATNAAEASAAEANAALANAPAASGGEAQR